MADAIARVVPPDTVAFAKGGSIDWEGFHCLCVPGQMIVSKVPVTFCMTFNWTGPAEGVSAMTKSYLTAVADVLQEASAAVG
jgi:beta-lactamase class A